MKPAKIMFIVVLALGIILCSGLVAAFTDDQASAEAFFSRSTTLPSAHRFRPRILPE